jgi:hypothetical protein
MDRNNERPHTEYWSTGKKPAVPEKNNESLPVFILFFILFNSFD